MRIISITATLVNVGFRYVGTIRFRVRRGASSVQRLRVDISAIASADANAIEGLAGASEKSFKIQQKWKKCQPKSRLVSFGWFRGWPLHLDELKTKQKWKKKRLENHGKESP